MKRPCKISSVFRWLFMVQIGWVVLETTQPVIAAGPGLGIRSGGMLCIAQATAPAIAQADTNPQPDSPPSHPGSRLIVPSEGEREGKSLTPIASPDVGRSVRWLLVAFIFAACAAWLWWKRRSGGFSIAKVERKLRIEETRSLGSRQHLVIVRYENRKFLLGVTTGNIQYIASLGDGNDHRKGDSWRRSQPK